jgi:hypothetical protein
MIDVPLCLTAGLRRYTHRVTDIVMRTEFPGGGKYITFDIPMAMYEADDVNLALRSRVYVSDARTARVVAEGRIADVSKVTSEEGQMMRVTAWGPKVHATEQSAPVIYLDTRASSWDMSDATTQAGSAAEMEDVDDAGESLGWWLRFDTGNTVTTSDKVHIDYRQLYFADQSIARITGTYRWGLTDGSYRFTGRSRHQIGSPFWWYRSTAANGGSVNFDDRMDLGPLVGHQLLRLGFERLDTSTTATQTHWVKVYNLKVWGLRYTASGLPDTNRDNYLSTSPYDWHIVEDVLGRLLPDFDGANAQVQKLNKPMGHFAYLHSATAEQILADVCAATGTMGWTTEPAQYYGGKTNFQYWSVATYPNYEMSLDSPADLPKSITEIYNKVTVRWLDKKGRPRNTVVTRDLPLLGTATRQAFIDLGSTLNDAATATTLGNEFLKAHSKPSGGGTVTINRPIKDLWLGEYRQPWEVRPRIAGTRIRLRSPNDLDCHQMQNWNDKTGAEKVNLLPNPSIEMDTTGYSENQCTISRSTAWSTRGVGSLRIVPSAGGTDVYAAMGGGTGSFNYVTAGKSYRVKGTIQVPQAQAAPTDSRARTIVVYIVAASLGAGYHEYRSNQAPNVAGTYDLQLDFHVPSDATECFFRLYNGSGTTTDDVRYDNMSLREANGTDDYNLFTLGDDRDRVALIVASEYTASTNTARLELESEPPSVAKALRNLNAKEVRRA